MALTLDVSVPCPHETEVDESDHGSLLKLAEDFSIDLWCLIVRSLPNHPSTFEEIEHTAIRNAYSKDLRFEVLDWGDRASCYLKAQRKAGQEAPEAEA